MEEVSLACFRRLVVKGRSGISEGGVPVSLATPFLFGPAILIYPVDATG